MADTTGIGHLTDMLMDYETTTYGTLEDSTEIAMPFVSEGLTSKYAEVKNDVLRAEAVQRPPAQGNEAVTGPIVLEADYDNIKEILGYVLGTGTTGTATPADENVMRNSVIIDKKVRRYQFLGGVINRAVFRSDANSEKLMIDTDWIFQHLNITSDAMPGSASLTVSEPVKHSTLVFRINQSSNGALDANDALKIESFTLTVDNHFGVVYGSEDGLILQPMREAKRETKFEFTAARLNTDAEITNLLTEQASWTNIQADLIWTGGLGSNALTIQLPEMRITEPAPASVEGAGAIPFKVGLTCYKNVSHDTLMGDANDEIRMVLAT